MTHRDDVLEALEALKKCIEAWEVLPGGHYTARQTNDWLSNDMKPAIDRARTTLVKVLL